MINDNMLIDVTNRVNYSVGYTIPELNNLHRSFTGGETKRIKAFELRRLSWTAGGRPLIKDFLIVHNEELVKELLSEIEPEYFYTKEDVLELLTKGSEDELEDALEFGPEGVAGLIKDVAVEIKLNDIRKRNIILKHTGFDITNCIRVNEESNVVQEPEKTRRVATENSAVTSTVRRAATPAYKIANSANKK